MSARQLLTNFLLAMIWTLTVLMPSSLLADESHPVEFYLEGLLTDSGGNPIIDNAVTFKIQIYSPDNSCMLYEETQTNVDLLVTNGQFNLFVGSLMSSSKRSGNDDNYSMVKIFSNSEIFPSTGVNCPSGYTPNTGDNRILKVTVNSTSGSETLPDIFTGTVPHALVATSLQGLLPTSFLQSGGTTTQVNLDLLMSGVDVGNSLHYHDSHNDLRYLPANSTLPSNLGTGGMTTSGGVGIGTSSPATPLAIENNGGALIELDDSDGSGTSGIIFQNTDINVAQIYNDSSTNELRFNTNGINAIKITPTQQVTMANTLTVNNGISSSGTITTTGSINGANITASSSLSSSGEVNVGSYLKLGQYDNASEALGLTVGDLGKTWYNTDSNVIKFWNGATVQSVSGSGDFKSDGSVSMSGPMDLNGQDINMNGGKLINLADPTTAQGAVTKIYAETNFMSLDSGGYSDYTPGAIACTFGQILEWTVAGWACANDDLGVGGGGDFFADGSVAMTGTLNMGGAKISNLANPAAGTDAVNLNYLNANTILPDGTVPMTGNLSMAGNQIDMGTAKITNLASPAAGSDAVNLSYIMSNVLLPNGSNSMSGALQMTGNQINMGTAKIINLDSPTASGDAVNLSFLESFALAKDGSNAMSGSLSLGSNNITNVQNYSGNGNITSAGTLNIASNTLTVDSTNNNVGIGTSTPDPTVKLHVNGPIKYTNGAFSMGKVLTSDANGVATWQAPPGEMIVIDQRSSGIDGGPCTDGWNNRVLNTIQYNSIPAASLATNEITLPAGKYIVEASAPAFGYAHKVVLYNETAGTNEIFGSNEFSYDGGTFMITRSKLIGKLDLAGSTTFSIRHYFGGGGCGGAIDKGVSIGIPGVPEVYTQVHVRQIY